MTTAVCNLIRMTTLDAATIDYRSGQTTAGHRRPTHLGSQKPDRLIENRHRVNTSNESTTTTDA